MPVVADPLQPGPARDLVTSEGILYVCEYPHGATPRTVVLGHPAGLAVVVGERCTAPR